MENDKKTETRRGATIRCKEKICGGGNPKPKDLIEATTFTGTICKHCFCVHEWEKNLEPEAIEIEVNPTDKEVAINTDKLLFEAKKRPKKKYVKQTGLDFNAQD